ncbi:RagB/SusD family nutrient uptake outer membrane protein [Longitalea luteola]|uniref:RagB/SusD family nutrient uptake outer membrane protein n=1 Tax=Longitalea luteola TaxID=2812563 RepID=UPI001A966528|nr:RagB/SusD family nutrient uptake outer membrane protein [Longitalea luteola]
MPLIRSIYMWAVSLQLVAGLFLLTGCNKLLDAGSPPNKVVSPQVYANDSLAQAALIGVYFKIMDAFGPLNGYMSRYPGLSADELDRWSPLEQDQPFLTNSIPADNRTIFDTWNNTYSFIYQCNDLIEGLTAPNSITPTLRDQLLGEAYFLRAYNYFYLVNLFGDVPLVLTTDYTKSSKMPRTPVAAVYDQMIDDLLQAENLLTDTYVTTPDFPDTRIRVNRLAVKAFQARLYLYLQQWSNAATAATAVIQSGIYQLETDLSKTFRYKSREAILQFMPVSAAFNTAEGSYFVPLSPNGRPAIILSDSLMKKIDPVDKRRAWIRTITSGGKQYNSPYKYKLNTSTPREEYNMVLRLAEQYCIRAEAFARLDQLPEAVSDLNTIRNRAGLPDLTNFTSQSQALIAIEQERRFEFFAEWGHRWFDLKRWPARTATHPGEKRIDEVMRLCRPATWKTTAALWPIPAAELISNRALTQNEGYN